MKFTRAALLSLILLLLDAAYGYSRVHIGFKGGYNMGLHYGNKSSEDPYDVTTHFRHAAGGGAFIYVGITESFGIQHELLYIMKGSREDIVLVDAPVVTYVEYDMNYLEIPVAFKFTAHRFKGFSLYGMSGFALSILLKSHYELAGTVEVDVGAKSPHRPSRHPATCRTWTSSISDFSLGAVSISRSGIKTFSSNTASPSAGTNSCCRRIQDRTRCR